ncbi:hypothetical protein ABK040_011009 [Willaertia magna]
MKVSFRTKPCTATTSSLKSIILSHKNTKYSTLQCLIITNNNNYKNHLLNYNKVNFHMNTISQFSFTNFTTGFYDNKKQEEEEEKKRKNKSMNPYHLNKPKRKDFENKKNYPNWLIEKQKKESFKKENKTNLQIISKEIASSSSGNIVTNNNTKFGKNYNNNKNNNMIIEKNKNVDRKNIELNKNANNNKLEKKENNLKNFNNKRLEHVERNNKNIKQINKQNYNNKINTVNNKINNKGNNKGNKEINDIIDLNNNFIDLNSIQYEQDLNDDLFNDAIEEEEEEEIEEIDEDEIPPPNVIRKRMAFHYFTSLPQMIEEWIQIKIKDHETKLTDEEYYNYLELERVYAIAANISEDLHTVTLIYRLKVRPDIDDDKKESFDKANELIYYYFNLEIKDFIIKRYNEYYKELITPGEELKDLKLEYDGIQRHELLFWEKIDKPKAGERRQHINSYKLDPYFTGQPVGAVYVDEALKEAGIVLDD